MSQQPSENSDNASEAWLVELLQLPSEVLVSQRIPKKTLIEMGAGGRGGKKLVQEFIGELRWVASLQPSNTGLPGAKDDADASNEIEVIWGRLRSEPSRPSILTELTSQIHRSIPYPLLLAMTGEAGWVELSMAVPPEIESGPADEARSDRPFVVRLGPEAIAHPETERGLATFRVGHLPRISITDLYSGWFDRLLSMAIGQRIGNFSLSKSNRETKTRLEALSTCIDLESEMSALKSKASKTKQLRTRSDLNLELRQKNTELKECQSLLVGSAPARME